jgi:hypothetical protein
VPATDENPKTVFRRLPRKNLANFRVNGRGASESIAEFVARSRLTLEEIEWAERQPVNGAPSLRRLRTGLANAGFADIKLELGADREVLRFAVRLTPQVAAEDGDELLRLWVSVFRAAGFRIGFEEIGIDAVEGPIVSGGTLTGPINEICEQGAPAIEV